MNISLIPYLDFSTSNSIEIILSVGNELSSKFEKINLNNDVKEILIGVKLYENSSETAIENLETNPKKGELGFDISLDPRKFTEWGVAEFKLYLFKQILAAINIAFSSISIKINNKDYYHILSEFNIKADNNKLCPPKKSSTNQIEYQPISDKDFWNLIQQRLQKGTDLSDLLINKDVSFVYGFELKMRKLVNQLDKDYTLQIAKKTLGFVTDDSFLYFKCRIILSGQELFENIINKTLNKKNIKEKLMDEDGERLLYLADEVMKNKDPHCIFLPSTYGNNVMGYID